MDTPPRSPEASHSPSLPPGRPERSPERARSWARTLFKGFVNLVTVGLIIFLTYHFTVFFGTRAPVAAPSNDAEKAIAKKAEDLRAQEQKILSSYGWVNPATRRVRIPVERAMELVAAENAQPGPAAAPGTAGVAAAPSPIPVVAKAVAPNVAAAPAAPATAAAPPARAQLRTLP